VGEPWLLAVPQFELRLDALKARPRVKAVRSLAEVAEGLRIAVCSFSNHAVSVTHFPLGSDQNPSIFSSIISAHSQ
jgi:hypothetical protein